MATTRPLCCQSAFQQDPAAGTGSRCTNMYHEYDVLCKREQDAQRVIRVNMTPCDSCTQARAKSVTSSVLPLAGGPSLVLAHKNGWSGHKEEAGVKEPSRSFRSGNDLTGIIRCALFVEKNLRMFGIVLACVISVFEKRTHGDQMLWSGLL